MRGNFSIILTCLILATTLFSACNTREVRRTMQQMMQEEVRLPGHVVKVTDGKTDTVSLDFIKPLLIIWTDSLQCSSCRVNQLQKYLELFEESKEEAFEMLILFSPARKDIPYLTHVLSFKNYPFPVYIDINNEFPVINTLPDEPKYHSFLLNYMRMPIFVGDPTTNNKLWSLFHAVVESNKENQ